MAINDWSAIQTLFDKLHKDAEKAQRGGASAASSSTLLPRPYIKMLAELEDFVAESVAAKRKLSPTNAKAFNTMRQRLRKHNAGFAEALAAWRADPTSSPSEASEGEGAGGGTGGRRAGGKGGADSDDDDDSDDEARRAAAADADADGGFDFEKVKSKADKRKDRILSLDPKEITYAMVASKLRELVTARGKKGVDRQEQVDMLSHLANVARAPGQRVEALVHVPGAAGSAVTSPKPSSA